jgi:hypothetical protein
LFDQVHFSDACMSWRLTLPPDKSAEHYSSSERWRPPETIEVFFGHNFVASTLPAASHHPSTTRFLIVRFAKCGSGKVRVIDEQHSSNQN